MFNLIDIEMKFRHKSFKGGESIGDLSSRMGQVSLGKGQSGILSSSPFAVVDGERRLYQMMIF